MFRNTEDIICDLENDIFNHLVRLDKNLNNMLFAELFDYIDGDIYDHIFYEMANVLNNELE